MLAKPQPQAHLHTLLVAIIFLFSGCIQTGTLSPSDDESTGQDTSESHSSSQETPCNDSVSPDDTADSATTADEEVIPETEDTSDADVEPEAGDTSDADVEPGPEDTSDVDVEPETEDTSDADVEPEASDTAEEGCSNPQEQDLGFGVTVSLTVTASWESGQSVDGVLTNTSAVSLESPLLYVDDPSIIASIWELVPTGTGYTLPSWSSSLSPGASMSFGMTISGERLPCFSLNGPTPGDDNSDDTAPVDDTNDEETSPITPTPIGEHKIVAYFVEWGIYQRDYHVADIPADLITHLNYAFANISDNGECVLYDAYAATDKFYPGDSWESGTLRGSFNQLIRLKEEHPHLKTLISVGGWTLSSKFPEVASTAQSRAKFAESCVRFMEEYGFDGIDIDWEYPVSGGLVDGTPADRENFTALLAELRSQLHVATSQSGQEYLLTIAAPAGPSTFANIELDRIHQHLDFINVMTYDFHGGWEQETNLNAPLYPSSTDPFSAAQTFNADSAITAYLDAGIPAHKVVMGLPFYGRGWQGVSPSNDGLYQNATGPAQAGTWEPGVFDYSDIVNNYLDTYEVFRHPEAQVPWLYSPSTGVMISYDDPQSLELKATYAKNRGLGGVMFWELSSDTQNSELLWSIYEPLSAP